MEILTWEEFITQKQRFDCPDCPKVKIKDRKGIAISECINCYGEFCRWDSNHRDTILLDDLRKKLVK